MIPLLLVAAGSILAASSMKKKVFAEGGSLSHSDQMIDIMNAEREEEARKMQSHSDQVIDIMNAERRYSGGGDIGNSFTISEMKDYLNDEFPDSFRFELFPLKEGTVCTPDYDAAPLHGLTDSDLGGKKLEFPPYKREHSINFDMNQGQENTYFHFLLSSTDGYEGYAGGFGFKDRGDVDSSYITKFLALLLKMYGVPFKVEHSVMAKGGTLGAGSFAEGGKIDKDLKEFVKSLPQNTPTIIKNSQIKFGEVGIMYALDYIIESGETNVKSKLEHKKIMEIIEDNSLDFYKLLNDRFKNKIRFDNGGTLGAGSFARIK